MSDHRRLQPLSPQLDPPAPNQIRKVVFRPIDPADRGDISFDCPTCSQTIIEEMAEHFVARSKPVWCDRCKTWLSPSGKA